VSRALLVWLGCAVAAGAVALAIVLHGAPAEPRWGGGQAVVGGVYPGVQNLRLASSPDGHAVAVFEAGGRAYVSARAPGRRFTPPASISGSGVAAPPSVAVGVHGQALVAWAGRADPSAATTLQTAIRTDGVSAFQPLPVTAGSTPLDARAVFTPDGVPNVVWVQSRGGNRRVLASRLGATGTFDPPTELLAGHDVEVLDAKASPEGVWALAVADGALTAVMLTPGGKPVATRLDAAPDGGAALGAGTSGDVVAVWSFRRQGRDRQALAGDRLHTAGRHRGRREPARDDRLRRRRDARVGGRRRHPVADRPPRRQPDAAGRAGATARRVPRRRIDAIRRSTRLGPAGRALPRGDGHHPGRHRAGLERGDAAAGGPGRRARRHPPRARRSPRGPGRTGCRRHSGICPGPARVRRWSTTEPQHGAERRRLRQRRKRDGPARTPRAR